MIKLTSTFERELVALGFLDESCTTLSSYVKDINVHFANKKVRHTSIFQRRLLHTKLLNGGFSSVFPSGTGQIFNLLKSGGKISIYIVANLGLSCNPVPSNASSK